jgi:hypothetical protein
MQETTPNAVLGRVSFFRIENHGMGRLTKVTAKPMKRILPLCLTALLLIASPVVAQPKVTCDVKVISRHEKLVTFGWEATIQADRSWDACDLIISFQDEKGREIHALRETLQIRVGSSTFSGHDICDASVWKRVKKYAVTLDCVF